MHKIHLRIIGAMKKRSKVRSRADPDDSRRRPKGGKRERTRARLVEAAAAVIGEKGWDRTSLEEVARRAGMTRGAIYGNFKDREELFLCVVQTRWKPVMPQCTPGTTFQQHLHAVGRAVAAVGPERRAQALGALSFMLNALTHDEMRAQLAVLNKEVYKRMAEGVAKTFPREQLPLEPTELIPVLHALADGLTFLRFLTPELVTPELIVAAFDALARGKPRS
jgi:AcrR family transcriptional regulator